MNDEIICMSVSVGDYTFYIFEDDDLTATFNILKPLFANPEIIVCGHNIKFDQHSW